MTEAYRVKHGGLMRCCLATLDDAMVAAVRPPTEGDTLRCAYCKDEYGMVFTNGAWQWNAPSVLPKR
jgi:hypothetical protein